MLIDVDVEKEASLKAIMTFDYVSLSKRKKNCLRNAYNNKNTNTHACH